MQPKITFTASTPTDQTNTGDASISITLNPDGSVKFETVVQTKDQQDDSGKNSFPKKEWFEK
jgi:hypothetical protein